MRNGIFISLQRQKQETDFARQFKKNSESVETQKKGGEIRNKQQ